MPGAQIPTITEVERIAALTDPVQRNLQITQCYHELAVVLAERSGGGANWCCFATWASKQAGQTIRKEDLGQALETVQHQGPALALLLAGPALSLPSMLVINSILGPKKTFAYVSLVVVMATISGMVFGAMVG